ncbi:MAG TPA: ATP-binding protein [Clostridiales bacterium]|jgi:DNA replication protein DnaC|nr:ATP-binding protein [Clostridiales bacterium]
MKDKLLNEVLREYDAYRLQQQEALKQREAEVLSALPELASLRNSLVTSLAQKARALILNPGHSPAFEQEEQLAAQMKKKEAALLRENGYPEDFLTLHHRCPVCRDTGYVGSLVKEKCSCLIQQLLDRTYRFSELSNLDKENFDSFDEDVFPDFPLPDTNMTQKQYMKQLKTVLWDYQEAYPNNPRKNLLFTGKTGLGKTFLLNCLAKAILDKGDTVLKVTSYNLFEHLFRSSFGSIKEDSFALKDRIFDVDTLIIDDLGTETRRNNFTAEELFNILNERYLNQKHTFLSTNLTLADLRECYSDRVTSRLFDTQNTMILRFQGQDIRLRKQRS